MELLSTTERIIAGASELFFAHGYSKVTMEEIAESVGITKKTIYNHFPNKLDLLDRVIAGAVQSILKTLESIAGDPNLDFLEKITKMLEFIFIEFTVHKRNLLEEFTKYTTDANDDILPDVREKLVHIIQKLFDEGVSKGLIKESVSRDLIPYTYISLVWGIIVLYRRFNLEINPGELLVQSIHHTFGGILTSRGLETIMRGRRTGDDI
jgi:AcrR family transcriptional regulator